MDFVPVDECGENLKSTLHCFSLKHAVIVEYLCHESDDLRYLFDTQPVFDLGTELHFCYRLLLVAFNNFFIKHLHCLHDESNIDLLVLDIW